MNDQYDTIPTRKSLLGRLKDWNDQESWRVFFDTYWQLIYNAAIKAGLSDAEAQDVVQETVISVLKALPNFEYDSSKGSFKHWLMRLTHWRIADQVRKRQPAAQWPQSEPQTSTETGPIEPVSPPVSPELEAVWEPEWPPNFNPTPLHPINNKLHPHPS